VPDLKIRNAALVDFGRKQKFQGIIAEDSTIREFDHGEPIVEHLKGRFLPFPFQDMADDENRLSSAFGPQILQGALSSSGAGERLGLSACICSDDWHMKTTESV
jgi:hypothetical protein